MYHSIITPPMAIIMGHMLLHIASHMFIPHLSRGGCPGSWVCTVGIPGIPGGVGGVFSDGVASVFSPVHPSINIQQARITVTTNSFFKLFIPYTSGLLIHIL